MTQISASTLSNWVAYKKNVYGRFKFPDRLISYNIRNSSSSICFSSCMINKESRSIVSVVRPKSGDNSISTISGYIAAEADGNQFWLSKEPWAPIWTFPLNTINWEKVVTQVNCTGPLYPSPHPPLCLLGLIVIYAPTRYLRHLLFQYFFTFQFECPEKNHFCPTVFSLKLPLQWLQEMC